jgi:mannose-6-phosphate isomerase-like protein (cupin superfamily)
LKDLIKNLADLIWIDTKHVGVQKKVCFAGEELLSKVTQVAYTELETGKEVAIHHHDTMEEVFFIIDGNLEFNINGKIILAGTQSVIRIPVNCDHSLKSITSCRFLYFGIEI